MFTGTYTLELGDIVNSDNCEADYHDSRDNDSLILTYVLSVVYFVPQRCIYMYFQDQGQHE